MSMKFVFLLFSTLLLAQCILANTSSEEHRGASTEQQLDKNDLTRITTKRYNKLVDKTMLSTRRNLETLIHDVQTNKITTNPKLKEKLNELKTVLDRATKTNTNTDDLNETKHNNRRNLKDLGKICKEMNEIEQETTDPTDGDKTVRRSHDNVRNELNENVKTFAERTLRDVDAYLNTQSTTTQQKEKHNLRDTLVELKNETNTQRKLELLDRVFIFNDDTEGNRVTKH